MILGIFAEFMAPRIFYPLIVLGGGGPPDPSPKIAKNAPIDLKIYQYVRFRANFELTKNFVILGIFAKIIAPRIFYYLRVLGGGGGGVRGGTPKLIFFSLKSRKMRLFT